MSRAIPFIVAALLAGAALPAAAQGQGAAPGEGRQCFSPTNVSAVQPVGDRQVNVRVGVRDVYRIDLADACNGLRSPQRVITVRPIASGVSVCSAADFVLATDVDGFREECAVQSITKLTPDQVAALPNRERP